MRNRVGRLAILTGAAGTIGKVTSHQLINEGHTVVGVDIDADGLAQISEELGKQFQPIAADLSSEKGMVDCCTRIRRDYGHAGILINNAGIIRGEKFLKTRLEDLRHVMALNFETAFVMSQQMIPDMVDAGGGRIINVSSFAGRSGGLLAGTAYSLSKTAMIGLTYSLAREFGPKGISTNAIAPAFVRSEMMNSSFKNPGDEQNLINSIPLRRMCDPEEVASAIIYLASDLSGFINGEVLDINGGVQCD